MTDNLDYVGTVSSTKTWVSTTKNTVHFCDNLFQQLSDVDSVSK